LFFAFRAAHSADVISHIAFSLLSGIPEFPTIGLTFLALSSLSDDKKLFCL